MVRSLSNKTRRRRIRGGGGSTKSSSVRMSSGAYTQLSQLQRERSAGTPADRERQRQNEVQRLLREQVKSQARIDAEKKKKKQRSPPRMYSRAVGRSSSPQLPPPPPPLLSPPSVWTQLTHHGLFGPPPRRTFSRVIERPSKSSSTQIN